MTIDRAKTIEMARQCGCVIGEDGPDEQFEMSMKAHDLERFYALVRAQVIEEAAQVCDEEAEFRRARREEPIAAIACAAAIRGMKSDSGHSATADAGASTAPPDDCSRTHHHFIDGECIYCLASSGASTAPLPEGEAAAAHELAAMFRQFTKSSHRWHDGRSVHIVAAEVLERVANATGWPAGLLDRVKAAAKRIDDNRAPRSIPADPHSDVDLVLAEVRCYLEGSAPPFWMKDAPSRRSLAGDQKQDEQAESASASPSVLLIRGEK